MCFGCDSLEDLLNSPEIIGTALLFHSTNRLVSIFLAESMLPGIIGNTFLKRIALNFAAKTIMVGVDVLATLYAQMGLRHLPIDLNQLWLDLGVQSSEGRLVLDDSAPKAAIRQAITR